MCGSCQFSILILPYPTSPPPVILEWDNGIASGQKFVIKDIQGPEILSTKY